MNDDQLLRYSRHILLDEIGIEGQAKILAAHALLIGAGGLGSPAAMYLASAGIGRITLADGDTVDLTNLQRQILHTTERVGQPKAVSGKMTMAQINPEVEVVALQERAEGERLSELVHNADIVLDLLISTVEEAGATLILVTHAPDRVPAGFRRYAVRPAGIEGPISRAVVTEEGA